MSEHGGCRASVTCALQSYDRQRAENKQTNLGSYSFPTELMSLSHDSRPRENESPSPDHRTTYTGVVDTVLRYSNVLHLHQRVCHKIGDTMVHTSRFTASQLIEDNDGRCPQHMEGSCLMQE